MLQQNQLAPDFKLPRFGGGTSGLPTDGRHAILVFYKYNCPTCQLTLPYIQKMYDAYGDALHFLAVAQDGPERTAEFRDEYHIAVPTLMDEAPYRVSRSYDIETVPSIFLLNPDRTIRYAGDGFVKQDLLNLADVLAEKSGRPQIDVFGSDHVPEMKPG